MAEETKKTRKKSSRSKSSSRRGGKSSRRRQSRGFPRWLKAVLLLAAVAALAVLLYVGYCFATLPDIEKAVSRTRQPSTTVIAENGQEIKTFGNVYSEVITPSELPPYVVDAVISTEDRRFYKHFGFDVISFTRAMVTNLIKGRYAQGGSTITQQVAKNLFLTSEINPLI